jgi:phosphoglycerol transferase
VAWLLTALLAAAAFGLVRFPQVERMLASFPMLLGEPALQGGERDGGTLNLGCCASPGQVESMASWKLRLVAGRTYIVQATLENRGARDAAPLVIDLVGDAYDNVEQEFHVAVPAIGKRVVARAILPSGRPPETVWLRIFHSTATTVTVSDVSIRETNEAYVAVRRGTAWVLFAALAALTLSGADRLRRAMATLDRPMGGIPALWWATCGMAVALASGWNAMLGPPIVFADEFLYHAAAAAVHAGGPLGDGVGTTPDLPNRLFFALFASAEAAHAPFTMARALNVLALAFGLVALYLASRATDAGTRGLAVATGYGAGALATYSAYFMPDVLFGAIYLWSCTAIAAGLAAAGIGIGATGGALLAALTFVKPHGWVVVAAFLAYVLYRCVKVEATLRRRTRLAALGVVAGFGSIWILLQVVLPDIDGRSGMLGATYGGVLAAIERAMVSLARYRQAGMLFALECVLVAVVAAPALLYAIAAFFRSTPPRAPVADAVAADLARLSLLTLTLLMAMTAMFTVAIAGVGPFDVVNRLHWRYFNFALPLLVLSAGTSRSADIFFREHRNTVLGVWVAACIGAAFLLPRTVNDFVGAPELFFGWSAPGLVYPAIGAVAVGACVLFRRVPRVVGLAMVLAYTFDVIVGGLCVRQVQLSIDELSENRAGQFAAALAKETGAPLLLLGESRSIGLYRVAAYLPVSARFVSDAELDGALRTNSRTAPILVGERDAFVRSGITPIAEFGVWNVSVVTSETARIGAGSSMSRTAPIVLSFSKAGGGAAGADGLHPAEDWGAWSAAETVSVALPRAIDGKLLLTLRAHAFAGNVGKAIRLGIGGEHREFVLQSTPSDVEFALDLKQAARTVTLDGYRQIPPFEIGLKNDSRALGVGIWSMRIVAMDTPAR